MAAKPRKKCRTCGRMFAPRNSAHQYCRKQCHPKVPKKLGAPVGNAVLDDPENRLKLIEGIKAGLTRSRACDLIPLDPGALSVYLQKHDDFAQTVKRAEVAIEKEWLLCLRNTDKAWQRFAWLLERKWPERYAQTVPGGLGTHPSGAGQRKLIIEVTDERHPAGNTPEGDQGAS